MARPKVEVANYSDLYRYYEEKEPNRVVAGMAFAAFNALYQPTVHLAEDAREAITELEESGYRFLIAGNHVSDRDQYVFAAGVHQTKELQFLKGNIAIAGRDGIFRFPYPRRFVDAMGAVPVFRHKDNAGDNDVRLAANRDMVGVLSRKLDSGRHVVILPEGGRNREDPHRLQKIRDGIGRVACGVLDDTPVALLPMAVAYLAPKLYRHGELVIGAPLPLAADRTPESVVQLTEISLQAGLDEAARAVHRHQETL